MSKLPAGIVPKYDDSYPQYDGSQDAVAQVVCELGATTDQLAQALGIPLGLLQQWRANHPSFAASVVTGKEIADIRVERALYDMAVGTIVDDVKVLADGTLVEYPRRIDPQFGAAARWLACRQPKKWSEKQVHEMTGPDGGPLETITSFRLAPLE